MDRSKWDRECRQRELDYPVIYAPERANGTYTIKEYYCDMCGRKMYCDSYHFDKKGKPAIHDRRFEKGETSPYVVHHATHCIGRHGTPEQKEKYRKKVERDRMLHPERYEKNKKKKEEMVQVGDKKVPLKKLSDHFNKPGKQNQKKLEEFSVSKVAIKKDNKNKAGKTNNTMHLEEMTRLFVELGRKLEALKNGQEGV